MSHQDPISDLLTRLRNGAVARLRFVDLRFSRQKHAIAQLLKNQGFVDDVLVDSEQGKMRVFLRYALKERLPLLRGIRRMSKPSLRNYVTRDKIPKIAGGLGVAILSTSQGIVDGETAREKGVGGEFLCYVW